MKLKLLLTFTLFCNVLLTNATNNAASKTDNSNNEVVANEITCSVASTSFCSGTSVTVTFTASGTYASGNVFTAQLSNAAGSFTSPVNIGTLTATMSGTISATIPGNTTYGTGYRIRVMALNPSTIGVDNGVNITLYPNITPTFPTFPPFCSGSTMPVLPTTSPDGITGTWSPSTISDMITATYTFTPTIGQCATTTTLTITVNPKVTPTFTPIAPICSGTPLSPLPTTSINGITGTWSPALNNKATTTYTFTPTPGLCATTTTLTISVISLPIATSSPSNLSICSDTTTNINLSSSQSGTTFNWTAIQTGVTGAFNATGSSISQVLRTTGMQSGTVVYTITPKANGCVGLPITATVNVNPIPIPEIFGSGTTTICSGESADINLTSNILGTQFSWTVIPTGVTGATAGTGSSISQVLRTTGLQSGTVVYTITPIANGCVGLPITATVNVNPKATPTFPDIMRVCSGQNISLPTMSNNGIMGTWSPDFNNKTPTTYTFTPTDGQCATLATLTIDVVPYPKSPTITTIDNLHEIYVDNQTVVQPLLLTREMTDDIISIEGSQQWYVDDVAIAGANNRSYLIDTVSPNGATRYYKVELYLYVECKTISTEFAVNQSPVPAPSGNRLQSFTQGQTLADIEVIGSNIQWYADATGNRKASSSLLPLNTLLVNGKTYYASQTINGFESPTRLAVTVQVALSNNSFAFKDLQVSPNPIIDVLSIKSKEIVKNITVYNALGQEVYHKEGNGLEFRIELSHLVFGNYFVKVSSDNKQQLIKVIKK